MPGKLPHGRPTGRPRKRPNWQLARARAALRAYTEHPDRARIDAMLHGKDPQ